VTFVIDANVAVKWYVEQHGAHNARAVMSSGDHLIAPDLLVAEVANALWVHVRSRDIALDNALEAIGELPQLVGLVSAADLAQGALRMAHDLVCSPYDCMYAVLAIEQKCGFVTADRKFAERLRASRRLTGVKLLDEFANNPR
jgi:predicted nucleic acid-binding protein